MYSINDNVAPKSEPDRHTRLAVIIVMGVSGSGKTTLASTLAREWGMEYVEGDELHSPSNVEKMSNMCPLTDQDREPWLERIREIMECRLLEEKRGRQGVVITCSALKGYYRDILRGRVRRTDTGRLESSQSTGSDGTNNITTSFVYIKGSKELFLQRLRDRKGHFMKSGMLDSQFGDLESPEGEGDVVVVNAEDDLKVNVDMVKAKLLEK